jgi:hypothetical protein
MDYMDTADAGPLVSAMTPGAEHSCYVNPDNPQEAVLLKPMGLQVFTYGFAFLMGLAWLVIGAIMFRNIVLDESWKQE